MAEAAQDARQEFWRPPVPSPSPGPAGTVEVCDGCGTEFMAGARFCHACGAPRQAAPVRRGWTSYLEFHNIKSVLGLSTASLIAFLVGMVCLLMAAIAVGVIYSIQTFNDFQAVQLYRVEWLLGAIAAFVAGLLLRNASDRRD